MDKKRRTLVTKRKVSRQVSQGKHFLPTPFFAAAPHIYKTVSMFQRMQLKPREVFPYGPHLSLPYLRFFVSTLRWPSSNAGHLTFPPLEERGGVRRKGRPAFCERVRVPPPTLRAHLE